jgi:hypothetical protein
VGSNILKGIENDIVNDFEGHRHKMLLLTLLDSTNYLVQGCHYTKLLILIVDIGIIKTRIINNCLLPLVGVVVISLLEHILFLARAMLTLY